MREREILDAYKPQYKDARTLRLHLFCNEGQKYGVITVARSALLTIFPKSKGKAFSMDLCGCG